MYPQLYIHLYHVILNISACNNLVANILHKMADGVHEETILIDGCGQSIANDSRSVDIGTSCNKEKFRKTGFCYFEDKKRRVDFILEYLDKGDENTQGVIKKRDTYFSNLKEKEHLQLEKAKIYQVSNGVKNIVTLPLSPSPERDYFFR